jgi:hypothetical protein
MSAKLTGSCQCGSVRFTLARKPKLAVACHCVECQKLSSAPFSVSNIVDREDLTVEGELRQFDRPTELGGIARCFFCPTCSNRIYHDAGASETEVRLKGRLDDTSVIRPLAQVWTRSRQRWMGPLSGGVNALAGFTTQPEKKSAMVYARIAAARISWLAGKALQFVGLVFAILWASGQFP